MVCPLVASSFNATRYENVSRCFTRIKETYTYHSDLISQSTRLALNGIILAGKVMERLPQVIPRSASVWMNYTGIIYLNMMIRDMTKTCTDFALALQSTDWQGIAVTASRTLIKVSNVAFTIIFFGASLLTLCGYSPLSMAIYFAMRPLAITTLLLGIGDESSDYWETMQALEVLQHTGKQREIAVDLAEYLLSDKQASHLNFQTVKILRVIEEPVLSLLKQHAHTLNQHPDELRKALELKLETTRQNLYLRLFGYFAMGICRIYPDSLIQASLIFGISLYYTNKLVREKMALHAASLRMGKRLSTA